MSSQPQYQDPEWLHRKYHHEGLTQREIAERCSGARSTVRDWMNKLGIEARDPGIAPDTQGFDHVEGEPPHVCDCGAVYLKDSALVGHQYHCEDT